MVDSSLGSTSCRRLWTVHLLYLDRPESKTESLFNLFVTKIPGTHSWGHLTFYPLDPRSGPRRNDSPNFVGKVETFYSHYFSTSISVPFHFDLDNISLIPLCQPFGKRDLGGGGTTEERRGSRVVSSDGVCDRVSSTHPEFGWGRQRGVGGGWGRKLNHRCHFDVRSVLTSCPMSENSPVFY